MKYLSLLDKVNEKGQLSAANFARIEKKAKSNRVNDAYELESKGKKVKLVFTTDAATMERIAFLYTEGAKYATLVQISTEGDAVTADIFQRLKMADIDGKIYTKLQQITRSTEKFVDQLEGKIGLKQEAKKKAREQSLIKVNEDKKAENLELKTPTSKTANTDKNMKGEKNMKKETSKVKEVKQNGKTTYSRKDNLDNYFEEFKANLKNSVDKLVDNRQDKTKPYPNDKVEKIAKKVFELNAKNFDHYKDLVGDNFAMERKLVEIAEKLVKEHYAVEKKPVVKDVKFIKNEIIRRLDENRNVPMGDVSDEMYRLRVKNAVNDYRISKHVGQKDGKDVLFTMEDISKIDGVQVKLPAAEEFAKGLVEWVVNKNKVQFSEKEMNEIIDFSTEEILNRALSDLDVGILFESALTQKEFKSPIYKFSKELNGYMDEAGVHHDGIIDEIAKIDNYEERAFKAVGLAKAFVEKHSKQLDKDEKNERNWRAYLMIQAQGIRPLDPTVGKIAANRSLTEAEADELVGFARNISEDEKIEGLSEIENKVVKEKLATLKNYMENNTVDVKIEEDSLDDLNKKAEGTGYYFTKDDKGQIFVNLTDEQQKEVAERYKLTPEQQAEWDAKVLKNKEKGKDLPNELELDIPQYEEAKNDHKNEDTNELFITPEMITPENEKESNKEVMGKYEYDFLKPEGKPQVLRISVGKKNGEYKYLLITQHPKKEGQKSVYMLGGNSIAKCFDKEGNFVATPSEIFKLGGQVVDKITFTGKKNKEKNRPNASFKNYITDKKIKTYTQSLNEGEVLEIKNGKLVKSQDTTIKQFLKDNLEDKKYNNVVREKRLKSGVLASILGAATAALVAATLTHGSVIAGQENAIRAKAKEDVKSYFNEKGQIKVERVTKEEAENENSLFRYKVVDGKVVGIEGVGLIDTILREQLSKGVSLTGIGNGWLQLAKLKGFKSNEIGKVLGEIAANEMINKDGVEIDETCVKDKNGNPVSIVKIDGKKVNVLPVSVSDSNNMTEKNVVKYLKEIGLTTTQANDFIKGWNESFSSVINTSITNEGDEITSNTTPTNPEEKEDFTVKGNAFKNNLATLLGLKAGSDVNLVCADEENGKAYVLKDQNTLSVIDFSNAVGANAADKVSQAEVKEIDRVSANTFDRLEDADQSEYAKRFNKYLQDYKAKNVEEGYVNFFMGDMNANSENGYNSIQPSLWFVVSDSTGKITKIEEMIGKKVEYTGDLKQKYVFGSFIPGYIARGNVVSVTGDVETRQVSVNDLEMASGNFLGDGTVKVKTAEK